MEAKLLFIRGLAWGSDSVPYKILARLTKELERIPVLLTSLGSCNRVTREPKQATKVSKWIPTESAQAAQAGLRSAHPRPKLERRLLRSEDGNTL
jgi:hypothetical protein